jgi:hypothetical protein
MSEEKFHCTTHGEANEAYVCEHLVKASGLSWCSRRPDKESPWPDAWCGKCHVAYEREGEWNEASEVGVNIEIICHRCYERTKAECTVHYI